MCHLPKHIGTTSGGMIIQYVSYIILLEKQPVLQRTIALKKMEVAFLCFVNGTNYIYVTM
jgi:hypothetical protein